MLHLRCVDRVTIEATSFAFAVLLMHCLPSSL